jgi:hypothetical protein
MKAVPPRLRAASCCVTVALFLLFTVNFGNAQVGSRGPTRRLITQPVDESKLVTLAGNSVVGGVIHENGSLAGYSPADPANAEAPQSTPQSDPANEHTITVMFDYDFRTNPSCAEKPKLKTCIKQFVVYDISGQRFRLFSIPVPDGARGLVKGIKGESPKRIFLPGKHLIAVTAQNADGVESQVNAAKILVEVKSKTGNSISPAE